MARVQINILLCHNCNCICICKTSNLTKWNKFLNGFFIHSKLLISPNVYFTNPPGKRGGYGKSHIQQGRPRPAVDVYQFIYLRMRKYRQRDRLRVFINKDGYFYEIMQLNVQLGSQKFYYMLKCPLALFRFMKRSQIVHTLF